jgi:hypothetical protein
MCNIANRDEMLDKKLQSEPVGPAVIRTIFLNHFLAWLTSLKQDENLINDPNAVK